jgi:15-cis-phytoene synthase
LVQKIAGVMGAMQSTKISHLVGSSQHQAVADDSRKDEDNAAWVMELEPKVRDEWIERIGWIRLADRLAENELLDPSCQEFQKFYTGWNHLKLYRNVESASPYYEVLSHIHDRWFQADPTGVNALSIQSWQSYLEAIATYHKHDLLIDTLDEYETMLADLAGSFFQVLPFLTEKYWQSAFYFGVVDQFYNNLRDLQEDAAQGICYFPTEVLKQFGVSREEILYPGDFTNPGYFRLMDFWLNEYLPKLRQKASSLALAEDLHPSWRILRDWSLHRYQRIERIFRQCHFDYTRFPQRYWFEVKRDLKQQLHRVRHQKQQNHFRPPATPSANSLPSIHSINLKHPHLPQFALA